MSGDEAESTSVGEWYDWRAWSKVALYWFLAAAFLAAVLLACGLLIFLFGGFEFSQID